MYPKARTQYNTYSIITNAFRNFDLVRRVINTHLANFRTTTREYCLHAFPLKIRPKHKPSKIKIR